MTRTPPFDDKTQPNANQDANPLAALVAEFSELDEIEVSPAFRPMTKLAPKQPKPVETPEERIRVPDPEPIATDFTVARQPVVKHSNAQNTEDEIGIPTRSSARAARTTVTPTTSTAPKARAATGDTPSSKRSKRRGVMTAAAALVAFIGAGYLYVQGSQPASSETVVYEVPVFDDENPTTAFPVAVAEPETKSAPSVAPTPETLTAEPAPTISVDEEDDTAADHDDSPIELAAVVPPPVALPADPPVRQTPLGFDEKFSDEFPELEGQSLLDLATGVAAFAPSDIVPDNAWEEVSCGGCHSFDQASLCEQGAYYFNHDKARIARIQHPYGGGFKQKLMEWAEGGCR